MIPIQKFDSFLTEEDKDYIRAKILKPIWSWGHKSTSLSDNLFWKADQLEFDEFFNPYLVNKIKELTGDELLIERIYMNGHTAGSHGNLHTDSYMDQGRTFLMYCNDEWNPEWGGGTGFDIDDDIVSFYNKPWSSIYFQNNVRHFALPISKDYKGLRVSLAFKLLKI